MSATRINQLMDDISTATMSSLSRPEKLDAVLADLAFEFAHNGPCAGLRSTLRGVIWGINCVGVLSDEQAKQFCARLEQGAREGWL